MIPRALTDPLFLSRAWASVLKSGRDRSLSRFPKHEWTRNISTSPWWDANATRGFPPPYFFFQTALKVAGTHLCSRVERGAVRVSQKHHNGLNRSDWVSMANRKAITMGGKQQTEDRQIIQLLRGALWSCCGSCTWQMTFVLLIGFM